MSDTLFTRDNLDSCLKELAKEFRKINGSRIPAEIILIGGASVLINYGFREMTYDMDAIIQASSSMKDAINHVGDRLGLPNGWLNTDFMKTSSYTPKLIQYSKYYKTFSNVLRVRTVSAEYLIVMKLMAGDNIKMIFQMLLEFCWNNRTMERKFIWMILNVWRMTYMVVMIRFQSLHAYL